MSYDEAIKSVSEQMGVGAFSGLAQELFKNIPNFRATIVCEKCHLIEETVLRFFDKNSLEQQFRVSYTGPHEKETGHSVYLRVEEVSKDIPFKPLTKIFSLPEKEK